MVMLVGKISLGTVMDQIYIPKQRAPGLEAGTLVVIEPALLKAAEKPKPYYHNVQALEPIKVTIIERIFEYFEHMAEVDNVLVAGSFLEPGFKFGDIDVVMISDRKIDAVSVEKTLSTKLGPKVQVIAIGFKTLLKGISTDPLFEMLTSRFVSKKKIIFRTKREIRFKLLDIQLLDSNILPDNSELLSGREKYKLTRNMITIHLFLNGRKLSAEAANFEIEKHFGKGSVELIKENRVGKDFIIKYKRFHDKLFERIMTGVRNDSKQKQAA